jgi:hypothetical protein
VLSFSRALGFRSLHLWLGFDMGFEGEETVDSAFWPVSKDLRIVWCVDWGVLGKGRCHAEGKGGLKYIYARRSGNGDE